MKSYRKLAVLAAGLCAALLVTACGGSSTGSGNTSTPAATSAATATAKPKPTAIPHFTVESCQQLMSLDEMNNLFKPPASATTIVPTNGDNGGACNYEVSKGNIPLIIYFFKWNGPSPIPQSDIDSALSEAAGTELTINAMTPVSGIGVQAEYLEATGAGEACTSFTSSKDRSSLIASPMAFLLLASWEHNPSSSSAPRRWIAVSEWMNEERRGRGSHNAIFAPALAPLIWGY